MRQVTKKGLLTIVAAGGVLAMSGAGTALADSGAEGGAANSPGVLSGNNVQAPVEVPANVCGNTVSVVGLINPAFGNTCVNSDESVTPPTQAPTPEPSNPGQSTPEQPRTPDKPAPEPRTPEEPSTPDRPAQPSQPSQPQQSEAPAPEPAQARTPAEPVAQESPQLAETGSGSQLAVIAPLGGGLLLGGYVLYRRSRLAGR